MPNGEACGHGGVHTNMPKFMKYPYTKKEECLECCWQELVASNGNEEPKFILDNTSSKRSSDKWMIVGTGFKESGPTFYEVIRRAAVSLRSRRGNG